MSRARTQAACRRSVERDPFAHPLADALDRMTAETPAVRWLLAAGPVARRLNEESKDDA